MQPLYRIKLLLTECKIQMAPGHSLFLLILSRVFYVCLFFFFGLGGGRRRLKNVKNCFGNYFFISKKLTTPKRSIALHIKTNDNT